MRLLDKNSIASLHCYIDLMQFDLKHI